ncbi:UNVERIFIED_CONTAM: hypothetical protein Sradi_6902000 [Sesamum radiatum]|uniref:Reverse transcriptase domain-containing protein n=1 Tax=Sesamum radiatum TaxID=300843 RepID=A0AAW2JKA6_SESRA
MVLDSGLTNAGFEGEPFTLSKKRVWRRLDRVIYSQEWAELFNSTRVSHLLRRLSDHHPLLITATRTEDKVPSSFRFKHMWIMHPTSKKWLNNPWVPLSTDMAAGNEAEKQFYRLPSEANLINLNRQNAALVHALNLESEFWRQKSNCKWLEAGERKTKFFHSLVKKKRLKSKISRVMDNQQEITDSTKIKESAVHFFESILCDTSTTSLPHDFLFQFPQVHQDVLLNLCQPPFQDDIKEVRMSLQSRIVTDFFRGTPVPRSFTAISIILIPKNGSPQSWSEFRPISLCNVTNKILSKLLYTRLSQALPDLLSPSQSAFVPGRLIADNILLAQEMAHHLDMRYT